MRPSSWTGSGYSDDGGSNGSGVGVNTAAAYPLVASMHPQRGSMPWILIVDPPLNPWPSYKTLWPDDRVL